jgi:predicted TIM-barrel enzyme
MIMALTRTTVLDNLRAKIAARQPIIGGGAGTGISAKCEEAGGIDLIVIYNSGRYRMAGRGSLAGLLAYGNANDIVLELAREVIPVVKKTPVLAGINGTDPFTNWDAFLRRIKDEGFVGVQNFPTVGLIDGSFRANLEETGMGYALEIEAIAKARQMDLLTTPYVFNPEDARAMAGAGADILVAHMGLTTAGSIGAQTAKSLADCVGLIDQISAAARALRPDIIMLAHGGPIAMPEDARYILQKCKDIQGFYGASSMERLPTEVAIKAQVEEFAKITF